MIFSIFRHQIMTQINLGDHSSVHSSLRNGERNDEDNDWDFMTSQRFVMSFRSMRECNKRFSCSHMIYRCMKDEAMNG